MTHDPDANVTMPHGTEGDGFVIIDHEDTVIDNVLRRHCRIGKVEFREVWPGIEDEVSMLERLLK
jgi:hypothetical protein